MITDQAVPNLRRPGVWIPGSAQTRGPGMTKWECSRGAIGARALPVRNEILASNEREAERRQAHRAMGRINRMRRRVQRDALASRRSTAALATDKSVAQPQNRVSSKTEKAGVLPAFPCLQLSELLADRSSCRPSGDPGPPGSGVHRSARGHRTRSTSESALAKASRMSEIL
jgi:hypothetical protein